MWLKIFTLWIDFKRAFDLVWRMFQARHGGLWCSQNVLTMRDSFLELFIKHWWVHLSVNIISAITHTTLAPGGWGGGG